MPPLSPPQQLQEAGGDGGSPSPSHDENETLKAKVEKLKEELAASKRSTERAGGVLQAGCRFWG